jgi:hypothetical protein
MFARSIRLLALSCLVFFPALTGAGSALADGGNLICGTISDFSTSLGLTGISKQDPFEGELTLDPAKANNGTPGQYDCTVGGPCGTLAFNVMGQDLTADFTAISETQTSWDGSAGLAGFTVPTGGGDMVFLSGTVDPGLTGTGNSTATITPDFDTGSTGGTMRMDFDVWLFGAQWIDIDVEAQGSGDCPSILHGSPALSPPGLALLAVVLSGGALWSLQRRRSRVS